MIRSFKHEGLQRFFESGSTAGIQAKDRQKIRVRLSALDTASVVDDMDLPGFRLHPLKGKRTGDWAMDVSGNWRITFRFEDGDAHVLNYEDYH